jgi:hypothetical protein
MGLGITVAVPEVNSSAVFGFILTSSIRPAPERALADATTPYGNVSREVRNLLRPGSVTRPLPDFVETPRRGVNPRLKGVIFTRAGAGLCGAACPSTTEMGRSSANYAMRYVQTCRH